MKNTVRAFIFLLVISASAITQEAQSDAVTDFSGSYITKGFRPGEEYTVTPSYVIRCEIQRTGDYYNIRWFEKGKLAYYGLGLHVNGVLSASYLSVDRSIYGTVAYRDYRATKGYLVGAWCIAKTHPDALSHPSNGMEVLYPEK